MFDHGGDQKLVSLDLKPQKQGTVGLVKGVSKETNGFDAPCRNLYTGFRRANG
jgi:hypothetical protein